MKFVKNKVYYIEWTDASFGEYGWNNHEDDIPLAAMKTSGFLDESTKDKIVIKQNYNEDVKSNTIAIPKKWITLAKPMCFEGYNGKKNK